MSHYENLKEILQANPSGMTDAEIVYIFWTCFEVIEAQERLISEFEHHIDNARTVEDIKRKCANRYYSTSRLTAS